MIAKYQEFTCTEVGDIATPVISNFKYVLEIRTYPNLRTPVVKSKYDYNL